jgi:phage protein D
MAETTISEVVVIGRRRDEPVRYPRAAVLINGEDIGGLISWSTSENEFSSPDSFGAVWAEATLPKDRGAAWFDSLEVGAELEIRCGYVNDPFSFTASDLPLVFVGAMDDITNDWMTGELIVSGRDLTAKLMEAKTSEKFINRTASDVAETLAKKYGLDAVVTATTDKVGRLYKADNVEIQSERTEWDLLSWLARESGFVTYVQGRTLYFGPRTTEEAATPFVINRSQLAADAVATGNYSRLETHRTLTVAGDITVTVRSWGQKSKTSVTKTAKRQGGGTKQEFSYNIPGLSADQAQQKANQLLAELSQHERKLDYSGPGLNVGISDLIRLEGTGTTFDALYYPEAIGREWSVDEGYSMTLSAKNHPTEDQGAL